MIVAIHQPNFLPWLGYFYKMARADRFVFLDSVPFTKGGYTNRVRIKTQTGPQWLTVPVQTAGKLGRPIIEIQCLDTTKWRSQVFKTLEQNYRKCPHYRAYADDIRAILESPGELLAELNIKLVEYVASKLGIGTPTQRSSQMNAQGKAADLLIGLCLKLGADTYLSGSGGANYQEEKDFEAAGLKVVYANYAHPTYPQAFGAFEPGLSCVDLLFNCGPESARLLVAGSGGSAFHETRPDSPRYPRKVELWRKMPG